MDNDRLNSLAYDDVLDGLSPRMQDDTYMKYYQMWYGISNGDELLDD